MFKEQHQILKNIKNLYEPYLDDIIIESFTSRQIIDFLLKRHPIDLIYCMIYDMEDYEYLSKYDSLLTNLCINPQLIRPALEEIYTPKYFKSMDDYNYMIAFVEYHLMKHLNISIIDKHRFEDYDNPLIKGAF